MIFQNLTTLLFRCDHFEVFLCCQSEYTTSIETESFRKRRSRWMSTPGTSAAPSVPTNHKAQRQHACSTQCLRSTQDENTTANQTQPANNAKLTPVSPIRVTLSQGLTGETLRLAALSAKYPMAHCIQLLGRCFVPFAHHHHPRGRYCGDALCSHCCC